MVFVAPHAPPGDRVGSENDTLISLTMIDENFGTIRLAVQKLSSGNLGGGREITNINKQIQKILIKP